MTGPPAGIDNTDFMQSDPWYVPEKEDLISTVHDPSAYGDDSGLNKLKPDAITMHLRENTIMRYSYQPRRVAGRSQEETDELPALTDELAKAADPAKKKQRPTRKNPVFFYDMKFERMLTHEVIIGLLMHYRFANKQEFVDKCSRITEKLLDDYRQHPDQWGETAYKEFCTRANTGAPELAKAVRDYLGTANDEAAATKQLETTLAARMRAVYATHQESRSSKERVMAEESDEVITKRVTELLSPAPKKAPETAPPNMNPQADVLHHLFQQRKDAAEQKSMGVETSPTLEELDARISEITATSLSADPRRKTRTDPATEIDDAIARRMGHIRKFLADTKDGIRPEEEDAPLLGRLRDNWKQKVDLEYLQDLILPSLVEEDRCRFKTKTLRRAICGGGELWSGAFDNSRLGKLAKEEGLEKLTCRDGNTMPPRCMMIAVGGQGSGKSSVGEMMKQAHGAGNDSITLNTDWIKPLLFNREGTTEDIINHATMAHMESFYVFDRIANRWWQESQENKKTPSLSVEAARLGSWLRGRIRRGRRKHIELALSATTLPVDVALQRAHDRAQPDGSEPDRFSPSRRIIISHHDQYSHNLSAMLDGLPLDIYNTKNKTPVLVAQYVPPASEEAVSDEPPKGTLAIYNFPAMWDYFKKPKLNINAKSAADLWHGTELTTAFDMREYSRHMQMEFRASPEEEPYMRLTRKADGFVCEVNNWADTCRHIGGAAEEKEFMALEFLALMDALKVEIALSGLNAHDRETIGTHLHNAKLVTRAEAAEPERGFSSAYLDSMYSKRAFQEMSQRCEEESAESETLQKRVLAYADVLRKLQGAERHVHAAGPLATNANSLLGFQAQHAGELPGKLEDLQTPPTPERLFHQEDWVALSARHSRELARRLSLFDSAVKEENWKGALHNLFHRDGEARFPCFVCSRQDYSDHFQPLPAAEEGPPAISATANVPPLGTKKVRAPGGSSSGG